MKIKKIFYILCVVMLLCAGSSDAALQMTLDYNMIDFGAMNTGESKEVTIKGAYHNQLTCSSTNNMTWYLKAQVVKPFSFMQYTIPEENFKWTVVSVGAGKGIVNGGVNFTFPFSRTPVLIYTSDPDDNTGTAIDIAFRYSLQVPDNQVAGNYNATVRFIMIETL